MNTIVIRTEIAPDPINLDPRPCELCGLTIGRHDIVDHGDGPEFYCADVLPDDMTLDELECRAELRRQEDVAAILARIDAMDRPLNAPAPRARKPYGPAASTAAAFQYLVTIGDLERLKAWLAARPKDTPFLLAMLEGAVSC